VFLQGLEAYEHIKNELRLRYCISQLLDFVWKRKLDLSWDFNMICNSNIVKAKNIILYTFKEDSANAEILPTSPTKPVSLNL